MSNESIRLEELLWLKCPPLAISIRDAPPEGVARIPAAHQRGQLMTRPGCIGYRVCNELADNQLYVSLPADGMAAVIQHLETGVESNQQLEGFHRERWMPSRARQ